MVDSGGADQACRLHTEGVGEHRPCQFVGYQHPVLALGQTQRLGFAGELQAVRVLGVRVAGPTGVATSLDFHRVSHRGEDAPAVNDDFGIQVKLLAGDGLAAHGVDVDARHCGAVVGEEVGMHGVFVAKGHQVQFTSVVLGEDEVTGIAHGIFLVFFETYAAHLGLLLFTLNECARLGIGQFKCGGQPLADA